MNYSNPICLLGFGEVGQTIASQMVGECLTSFDILFESEASALVEKASQYSNLKVCLSPEDAAKDARLVICAVTPDQAMTAAVSVSRVIGERAFYLDLNSVSPHTKRELAHVVTIAGGRFVEAAVMSPIQPTGVASPILLGGEHAIAFTEFGGMLGFNQLTVSATTIGEASATKMCRSVIVKGLEALLTESLVCARYFGVERQVLESLPNLLNSDDWHEHAGYMIARSLAHGTRRAAEMQEVSKMISETGSWPVMSQACMERQAWAGKLNLEYEDRSTIQILDAIMPPSLQTEGKP